MKNILASPLDENKRLLLVLAVFPLTLLLLLIFREAIREWVVIPLLYLFWFINTAVLGLYQGILWFIFLLIALFVIYYSLKRFYTYKEPQDVGRRATIDTGRVRYWSNLLTLAGRGSVSLPYIASQLREELFVLIAYRQNKKPVEIERLVESGELSIPEEVRQFLFLKNNYYENNTILKEIYNFWRGFVPVKRRVNKDWVLKNIERTIEYMEEIVEIYDDNANR
jgi:hypothetical protein